MKAWLFQDAKQKAKHGDKARWSVGWYDPRTGRQRQKVIGSKSHAERYRRKLEGELAAGLYRAVEKKTWKDFRNEYETKIMPSLAPGTRDPLMSALNAFERHVAPARVEQITTAMIDDFSAARLDDPGNKRGKTLSPATVNKNLRHLKAVLRYAVDWKYLAERPRFRMLREVQDIGEVITEEHFRLIYDHGTVAATQPDNAPDWWKALLVFAITTGWRIGEITALRREDLDLETGVVTTRGRDNKGKRTETDRLPAATLEHVRRIVSFSPLVFDWPFAKTTLYAEFRRLQEAAGIHLPCRVDQEHECTPACHVYGFHSLRRGYATMNVDLGLPLLQKKMRHKSSLTTQRYIQLADKVLAAADDVHVPGFLSSRGG